MPKKKIDNAELDQLVQVAGPAQVVGRVWSIEKSAAGVIVGVRQLVQDPVRYLRL